MNFPETIPVARMEDYHTHYVGNLTDGRQFWGYETFVFDAPYHEIRTEWEKHRLEYIVLHLFDAAGRHLETRHLFEGTTDQTKGQSNEELVEDWLDEMGEFEYQDIRIAPFLTIIDGITFGLIPDEDTKTINLQPSSTISFSEPWDGEYNT